jgi:non-ribosomal peptide synthetase component E (peptide arylation enzyme)
MSLLFERLQQQADVQPDAIALRSRDRRLSYGELMQAVRQACAAAEHAAAIHWPLSRQWHGLDYF